MVEMFSSRVVNVPKYHTSLLRFNEIRIKFFVRTHDRSFFFISFNFIRLNFYPVQKKRYSIDLQKKILGANGSCFIPVGRV